jgi:hypothetical protein
VGSKNGSFDFAEALVLCVGAKANVPLWGGLQLFYFVGGKKLNLFSFVVILLFILKPFCLSFSMSLSFLRLVGNVPGLGEGGDFYE